MVSETMDLVLRDFEPRFAVTVASWVRSDADLLWLAPRTPPPMTPATIIAWTRSTQAARLVYVADEAEPCGYGEITSPKDRPRSQWFSHVIVDPLRRGSGLGCRFVELLLIEAFQELAAESISLVVFPDNAAAIRCYLKNGIVRRREEFHQFRSGQPKYRMLQMDIDRPAWLKRREESAAAQDLPPDRRVSPVNEKLGTRGKSVRKRTSR
ncbi:MAG: GNAT family N-acetyltransferase [Planctomycetes bacterium]|nr:GNAT family N-acetyltransferase [Planctomycetota bacterium]